MKKISNVLLFVFILFILTYSVLSFYLIQVNLKNTIVNYQIDNLKTITNYLIGFLKEERDTTNFTFEKFGNFLFSVKQYFGVRITIIDINGKVLFETDKDPHLLENHINRPEIQLALKRKEGHSIRFSNTINRNLIYFAKKVEFENFSGFVRTAYPIEYFTGFFSKIINTLVQILLILTVLTIILSTFFAKRLSKPILKISEAADEISKGNFDVKVPETYIAELGTLSKSFNEMTSKITQLFKELKRQKNFYQNVLESIRQSIAIFDFNGKLVFGNKTFLEIFNINESDNQFEFCDMPNSTIVQQIQNSIENRQDSNREVEHNGRYFYSFVRIIADTNQIIHILYDITSIKRTENIKKDLVANVSHELRTPLTAIKGYVETLEEEIGTENLKYLEIIKNNTNRIIRIVEDLLNLMSLEDVSSKLSVSEVDLKELAEQIIPSFKHKLEDKNLTIELNVINNVPKIRADAFRLEQVFINLIDNAIKFSQNGKITITILKNDDETVQIIFEDQGIGIPKEHLDRIFERFYKVDKTRTGSKGGSGLGLAIVKHIIMLHDGHIKVESEEGKGTKFIIDLPIS